MGLDAAGDIKSLDGATVAFTTGGNINNPHLSMLMDNPSMYLSLSKLVILL